MTLLRYLWLGCLLILGVTACTSDTASLPLVEGKPTLLFFYTEN